jgi:hypothetical protein
VTEDETSFHVLDAPCEAAVDAAALRAGIQLIRVVSMIESVAREGSV